MASLPQFFHSLLSLFGVRRKLALGLYGPPNGGKTTLANRIAMDWTGESIGKVSAIAHETRLVQLKERVTIKVKGRTLTFDLVDTPGIATRIDYAEFVKAGLKESVAKKRAKEATQGVIESIKWLEKVDVVLIVLDATKDPHTQVNITILENLEARHIPVILVANKTDLRRAKVDKVAKAFPGHSLVPVSAKLGRNMDALYETIAREAR